MNKFAVADPAELRAVIAASPLAAIVWSGPEGLTVVHVPLLMRGDTLVGHMARGNPLAKSDGADVLAIFRAADAYVTPNWYPSKAEHGKVVPTWNYVVTHAHGRVRVRDDAAWVRGQIEELTRQQEGSRAKPWAVADAPAGFIEAMQKAIVGLEIPVARLAGVRKASQNREERDRAGVLAGLAAEASPTAAGMLRWMAGEGPTSG
jgi:transcriptional regulator